MTKYQLFNDPLTQRQVSVIKDSMASIPFDPANTDYANFKAQILADEAQLEDADGNLMTPGAAKAFVATLV